MEKLFTNTKSALVVHLCGEIDQCAAAQLKDKIEIEILMSNKRNLIMNLDEVSLMDSSGIGLIVGRYKTIQSLGGKFALCGGSSSVRKMIDLSGIGKIIMIYKNVDDADKAIMLSSGRSDRNEKLS